MGLKLQILHFKSCINSLRSSLWLKFCFFISVDCRGKYFYLFRNFGCGIVSSISGKVLYFKWRKAIMKSWSTEFSLLCWNLILKNQYLRNIWNFKNYRISAPKINWLLNIVREINQIFKDFKNILHNILKRGLTIHHPSGTDDLALSRLSYRSF